VTCTDAQARLMMQERRKGRTQQQAAAKANINNRKTVAKYEKAGQLPSKLKKPRSYRTREDPFAEDWPELEEMLTAAPELEAVALFEWLCDKHKDENGGQDKYQEGQLRTLQRRVSTWKGLHQRQVAVLEQVHQPGEALQTDGTWLTELGVTIQGESFKHILIHCVLPYSNWAWGVIAQSESQLALQRGLQATLFQLGHVPEYHQTDNSSAATYQVRVGAGGERDYTPGYLALLDHFGLKPRLIQVGSPEQNGDIELRTVSGRSDDPAQRPAASPAGRGIGGNDPIDGQRPGRLPGSAGPGQPGRSGPGTKQRLFGADQPDRAAGHRPAARVATGGLAGAASC